MSFLKDLNISSKVKLNNGVEMPRFGLGLYLAQSGEETVNCIVYALTKANYLMLDSAQYYNNESDIGVALKQGNIKRDQVFITTKLFTTKDGKQGAVDVIESSLKQMNTDYIDQYLLHAPHGGKVLECYDVLLDYQRRNKIRTVGVSNFGVHHLEAIKKSGRPLPQVNQIELHPWCTNKDIVQWCRENGVELVGYCPLAHAKKLSDPFVNELAKKYNKTPAQVLIRYSLQNGFITIPKSTKPSRIDENANVFDFSLEQSEVDKLTSFGDSVKESCGWDPTVYLINDEIFGPTQ